MRLRNLRLLLDWVVTVSRMIPKASKEETEKSLFYPVLTGF